MSREMIPIGSDLATRQVKADALDATNSSHVHIVVATLLKE
jgi:hypothetical protein